MERAKKTWKELNIKSYTSGFEPTLKVPSDHEIGRMKDIMKKIDKGVPIVHELYQKLKAFLPIRQKTLRLIAEAILTLRLRHRKVNIAKVSAHWNDQ